MMTASDILDVISRFQGASIAFWLDGGWGVDALLGEETRPHDDLDVVVRVDQADAVLEALALAGFRLTIDDRPTRFVLAQQDGRRVDFHPIVFDESGDARQIGAGPNGGDAPYPAAGLRGHGRIAGHAVRCLTPELLLLHHTGYTPQARDWHNVRLLCERFGVPIPPRYEAFQAGDAPPRPMPSA